MRVILLAVALLGPAWAAEYTVPGNYATIQACADAAVAGDTCLVSAGTYNEHVVTKDGHGGTSDSSRVTFRANGAVTMQGFMLKHPYVTVDGFTITNRTTGHLFEIYINANYANIVNNTLGPNSTSLVKGIFWFSSAGAYAHHAYIHGNTFNRLAYTHLEVHGNYHTICHNLFNDTPASGDIMDVWGIGSLFQRNIFTGGTARTAAHPDWLQIFGTSEGSSGHVFEENVIFGIPGIQIGQLNAGNPTNSPDYYPGFGNITWRRNVFVDVSSNMNIGFEGATIENNTFYRAPYMNGTVGISLTCTLVRGMAKYMTIRNNAFIGNGTAPSDSPGQSGFYTFSGGTISMEVIGFWITGSKCATNSASTCPTEYGINADLVAKGYMDSNGIISTTAKTLAAQYNGGDQSGALAAFNYAADPTWKARTLEALARTADMEAQIRATLDVQHNYVGGGAGYGYPAKQTSACAASCGATPRNQCLVRFNFCEDAGINGGNPYLTQGANLASGIAAAAISRTSATWTAATKTLRKTGAFTAYANVLATDMVLITSASPTSVAGLYTVASKTDNDTIILGTLVRGTGIDTDRTNVTIDVMTPESFILGTSSTPFATDAGLKPIQGSSPLCGAGVGSVDIGAYACDPGTIFVGSLPEPERDTEAPTKPAALTALGVLGGGINLSWTASTDNTAVTGYKIYRDGLQVNTAASNSYSDSGLTAATLYRYTVAAYDAAGNTSAQSDAASDWTYPTGITTEYTVIPAGSGNYTTITACVAALGPGKLCLVHPGTYNEYVSINPGTAGNASAYVAVRALNGAMTHTANLSTMQGYRIRKSYTAVQGFDITGYNSGLNNAMITIDATAHFPVIEGNVIRDGTYIQRSDFVFSNSAKTITSATGGFLSAGFGLKSGETSYGIYIGSNIQTVRAGLAKNHDLSLHVVGATDTVLTLNDTALVDCNRDGTPETAGICDDGPLTHTIYVNRTSKAGVRGIEQTIAGGTGSSDGIYRGNTFRNLAGIGFVMVGDRNTVAYNTFEQMNGWKIFNLSGSSNSIDHDVFRDSPRWPDFPPPNAVGGDNTGAWDMIDSLIYSARVSGGYVDNNTMAYNAFLGMGNQLMTVSDATTGQTNTNPTSGWFMHHNIFTNLERQGSTQRPHSHIYNNTFIGSSRADGFVLTLGSGSSGTGNGGLIKSNVFLDSSKLTGNPDTQGWYNIAGSEGIPVPTLDEAPNYNYVAGAAAASYAAKTGFAGDETNGINGGDPALQAGSGLTTGILAVAPFTGGTWTASTKRITKTGAFTNYTRVEGDQVRVFSIYLPNATESQRSVVFRVVAKISNDTIEVEPLPGRAPYYLIHDTIAEDRSDLEVYPMIPESLVLGADAAAFTVDDGLKPSTSSPLCATATGGTIDIGAYSCSADRVFSAENTPTPPATHPNHASRRQGRGSQTGGRQ